MRQVIRAHSVSRPASRLGYPAHTKRVMAVVTGQPSPLHFPYTRITGNVATIPNYLGVIEAIPTADATYTLPNSTSPPIVSGAFLYIKNTSSYIITVNPAAGESLGSLPITILPSSTGAIVFTGNKVWTSIVGPNQALSVKNFNAKGDGVTDDTVAFQAAVNAASGRFTLSVPAGIYMVSQVVIPVAGYLHMRGEGYGVTTVRKIIGAANMFTTTVRATSTDYITIEDMTFDGQRQNQAAQAAIGSLWNGYILSNWRFVRCSFINAPGYGIELAGRPFTGLNKEGPQLDIFLQNCRFIDCGLGKRLQQSTVAVAINSSDTSVTVVDGSVFDQTGGTIQIENEIMRHGTVTGNVIAGLIRGGFGTTATSHAIGTVVNRLADSDGIDIKSSTRVTMMECYAKYCADVGFNPRGRYVRLYGCSAEYCGSGFAVNSTTDGSETDPVPNTTLNGGISPSDVTIVLTSVASWPTSGFVRIDSEEISYSGISVNSLTGCVRGVNGTKAMSHTNGTGAGYFSGNTDNYTYAVVDGCGVNNCYKSAFSASGAPSSATYYQLINCMAINNGGDGVFLAGANPGNSTPGSRISATISGGVFTGNVGSGIRVRSAYTYTINGTICVGNTENGIYIDQCPNGGVVSNNSAIANTSIGVSLQGSTTAGTHAMGNRAAGNSGASQIRDFSGNKDDNYFSLYRSAGVDTTFRVLDATATWDPPNIADGAMTSTTVALNTVGNATVGNPIFVGFSTPVPAGALLTAAITDTSTATVTLFNKTGAPLDLGSGTLRVIIFRPVSMT